MDIYIFSILHIGGICRNMYVLYIFLSTHVFKKNAAPCAFIRVIVKLILWYLRIDIVRLWRMNLRYSRVHTYKYHATEIFSSKLPHFLPISGFLGWNIDYLKGFCVCVREKEKQEERENEGERLCVCAFLSMCVCVWECFFVFLFGYEYIYIFM